MKSKSLRNTGRSGKDGRHIRLYQWMLQTEAWKSLDATARAVYIEIAGRYGGPGSNNGRIPYAVREAAEALRIGKATAHRALRDLEERGFVVAMSKGHFDRKSRHASEWRLTEFGCDVTGKLASREFSRWTQKSHFPVPLANRSVSVAEPNGFCDGTILSKKAAYGF
jgi:hypothetical protein